MSLDQQLEQAIIEIFARAAENRISLVTPHFGSDGARAMIRRLLERQGEASPGFRQLVQAGRLDLTVESLVLQARFRTLFSRAERLEARARLIDAIATSVNTAADGRPIGTLQATRTKRLGLPAVPALFGGESVRRNEGHAHHSGGNNELHFHIALVGFGREPWVRYGVAFDLRRGRGPSPPGALATRIGRFNQFLAAHPERYSHLQIQHHRHGEVNTFDPGPVPGHFLRPPAFIFLGAHAPFEDLSIDQVVNLFDDLLPLHHFVETGSDTSPTAADGGPAPPRGAPSALPQRRPDHRFTVDPVLRRRALRGMLIRHLSAVHGDQAEEIRNGGDGPTADCAVHERDAITLYGVSTALTVRGCLREALGRLLEDALRADPAQPWRLVVVGEAETDPDDRAYLARLQARLGITVEYRRIDFASDRLL